MKCSNCGKETNSYRIECEKCDLKIQARIAGMESELDKLKSVCAQAYQLAGVVGAPEKVLNNLSDAASGKPLRHPDGFLPLVYEDFEMWREGQAELAQCRELLSHARLVIVCHVREHELTLKIGKFLGEI